jgi:hypothetical protein
VRGGERHGRAEWQLDAERAVPTSLVRDIVGDAYRGISQSASLIPPRQRAAEEAPIPSGGIAPLAQPPGIAIIDAMCEAADKRDRINAIRQRVENAWIESHFEKGPRVAREYHPLRQYDAEVPPLHREKS